jgi:hypothetical protein
MLVQPATGGGGGVHVWLGGPTPQKKCRMKMISCLEATWGALYSSLNGLLCPCASKTNRSSTLAKSFSLGMSLFTSTVPSNSSCSFCRTGVWLDGEKGGVILSAASSDILVLTSAG